MNLKLFALTCGHLTGDLGYLMEGGEGKVELPIPNGVPLKKMAKRGSIGAVELEIFIAELERLLGRKAVKEYVPMQPGDVPATYADIEASARDLGFVPTTPISLGIPKFIAWFKDYYGV